jgi:predicted helicase
VLELAVGSANLASDVEFERPNDYLDNPRFRGMRRSVEQSFDEIYVVNLHGNTKKKAVVPDGFKDENVFDIQQGVSVSLMLRKGV